jgi:predicted transglutaminase-like cysteine proteinase
MFKYLEEKVSNLKTELQIEVKNRIESLENLNQIAESDLPSLEDQLRKEENQRNENDQILIKKSSEEMKKVNELINREIKAREDGD